MIALSDTTKEKVAILFPDKSEYSRVCSFLEKECGDNLPLIQSDYTELAERIRFAVLKLSQGSEIHLSKFVNTAKIDWRDTLMMAGFGGDTRAHLAWEP